MLTDSTLISAWQAAYCCAGNLMSQVATKAKYGVRWDCALEDARRLFYYLSILKKYKIPGDTEECCCSLEGQYSTTIVGDLPAKIEFLCDGTGYMLVDSVYYSHTWNTLTDTTVYVESTYPQVTSTTGGEPSIAWNTDFVTVYIGATLVYENLSGFATIEEFITDFNSTNELGFFLSWDETILFVTCLDPQYVGDAFQILLNDSIFLSEDMKSGSQTLTYTLTYTPDSSCNLEVSTNNPGFPLSLLENVNPCEPLPNPDGCLTVDDIEAIIRDINRLCSIYNCC